ncbi:DUF3892 domain-containing protein [Aquibacillus saliphilus]|uniref:DUF3892 domain-containing protein n=1 Tax=Aquibacillus saliphilus TaxID=1909422 RepID=UPI001CF0ADF5|nr:DUF3892 domain-containing protein [Aquibacillus saliphilus]
MNNKDFDQIYQNYKQQGEDQARLEQEKDDSDLEHIAAVRKNDDGDIIAFKTTSGRELDYLTALNEAKSGKLSDVDVFHRYGRDIIRSEPDGIKKNNLSNLDTF